MYELGIDLGTTFTAAAVRTGDRVEIAPLGTRSPVIPSVVLFAEDGTTLTGDAAQRRALSEPTRVAREFKRRLGDPLPVIVGGAPHSAESLSAILLRSVVETVSTLQGSTPSRVALTHPANWGSYKKELYAQAVRFADLPDVVFLTEPEAAAIHYASQERVDDGSIVAVYDLGGGTFDATVLEKRGDGFEVLGQPEGIERLGGIDFDQAVFSHVAESLGGALDELDRSDPAVISAVARMRADCIDAKEALSADTEASIVVALPGLHTEVRITRPELESMLRRPIADTVSALRRALRDASVEPDRLAAVLLVGGSSRIPMVAEMVGAELGRPVAVDAHPKYTIALGAARYAGLGRRRSDDPRPSPAAARPAVAAAAPAPVPAAAPAAPVALAPAPASPATATVTPPPIPAPSSMPAPAAAVPAAPVPAAPVPAATAPLAASAPSTPRVGDRVRGSVRSDAKRRRGLLIGGVAAAVLVTAGVGAALALGGGDAGGADAGGGNGCPTSGPFVCITSTNVTNGGVVAEFQLADVDLDRTDLRFFLDTNPDAFVSWSVTDPFRSDIGDVTSGVRLCAVVNDSSGSAIAGSGNCVALDV